MMTNSETKAEAEPTQIRGISFQLGTQTFALPIQAVKEVVKTPLITPAPLSPDYLVGLANIRGEVFGIIDLAKKLKLETTSSNTENESPPAHSFTLVLNETNTRIGIQVKEVPGTLNIAASQLENQVDLVGGNAGFNQYVEALIKQGEELIILLNLQKIVAESKSLNN